MSKTTAPFRTIHKLLVLCGILIGIGLGCRSDTRDVVAKTSGVSWLALQSTSAEVDDHDHDAAHEDEHEHEHPGTRRSNVRLN